MDMGKIAAFFEGLQEWGLAGFAPASLPEALSPSSKISLMCSPYPIKIPVVGSVCDITYASDSGLYPALLVSTIMRCFGYIIDNPTRILTQGFFVPDKEKLLRDQNMILKVLSQGTLCRLMDALFSGKQRLLEWKPPATGNVGEPCSIAIYRAFETLGVKLLRDDELAVYEYLKEQCLQEQSRSFWSSKYRINEHALLEVIINLYSAGSVVWKAHPVSLSFKLNKMHKWFIDRYYTCLRSVFPEEEIWLMLNKIAQAESQPKVVRDYTRWKLQDVYHGYYPQVSEMLGYVDQQEQAVKDIAAKVLDRTGADQKKTTQYMMSYIFGGIFGSRRTAVFEWCSRVLQPEIFGKVLNEIIRVSSDDELLYFVCHEQFADRLMKILINLEEGDQTEIAERLCAISDLSQYCYETLEPLCPIISTLQGNVIWHGWLAKLLEAHLSASKQPLFNSLTSRRLIMGAILRTDVVPTISLGLSASSLPEFDSYFTQEVVEKVVVCLAEQLKNSYSDDCFISSIEELSSYVLSDEIMAFAVEALFRQQSFVTVLQGQYKFHSKPMSFAVMYRLLIGRAAREDLFGLFVDRWKGELYRLSSQVNHKQLQDLSSIYSMIVGVEQQAMLEHFAWSHVFNENYHFFTKIPCGDLILNVFFVSKDADTCASVLKEMLGAACDASRLEAFQADGETFAQIMGFIKERLEASSLTLTDDLSDALCQLFGCTPAKLASELGQAERQQPPTVEALQVSAAEAIFQEQIDKSEAEEKQVQATLKHLERRVYVLNTLLEEAKAEACAPGATEAKIKQAQVLVLCFERQIRLQNAELGKAEDKMKDIIEAKRGQARQPTSSLTLPGAHPSAVGLYSGSVSSLAPSQVSPPVHGSTPQ